MRVTSPIIDDMSREPPMAATGSRWELVTDRVMGGVSEGTMVRAAVAGRPAILMRGEVRLENNGGFVQIALDLSPDGGAVDASAWSGLELDVFGDGAEYGVHLRTTPSRDPGNPTAQVSRPRRNGGRSGCRSARSSPTARTFPSMRGGCVASASSRSAAPSRPVSPWAGFGSRSSPARF